MVDELHGPFFREMFHADMKYEGRRVLNNTNVAFI